MFLKAVLQFSLETLQEEREQKFKLINLIALRIICIIDTWDAEDSAVGCMLSLNKHPFNIPYFPKMQKMSAYHGGGKGSLIASKM